MRTLAAVLAGVAFALVALLVLVRRARSRLANRQAERLRGRSPLLIDGWANLFGVASRGYAQLRGNGALVLTAEELWFGMLLPARELTIPLVRVTAVDTVGSHLGKSTLGHNLLRVEYTDEAGSDAAAWAVRDPEVWAEAVRRAVDAAG